MFAKALADLEKLKIATHEINYFKFWVVGLDLFGDEMGYPYCPFVAWPFLQYIKERRSENQFFGLRIHCGENVPFTDNDVGAYRHFIAHMYIAFRCLRFLHRKLGAGIRIGHGIAFARILGDNMDVSTHRKSSVLLAEMREHAEYVLKNIVFEINITSNEYLLGQALREGCYNQVIRLSALTDRDIPIILSTDDDGIWPIDHCPSKHPGHHSLIAEYCRAFSLSIITSPTQLQTMLRNTNKFCFYSLDGAYIPLEVREEDWKLIKDDTNASTIIFHPDVIKTIMAKYNLYSIFFTNQLRRGKFYQSYQRFYDKPRTYRLSNLDPKWVERCAIFAQIAYIAFNTNEDRNTLNSIEAEFALLFPHSPHLETLYNAWISVRTVFMFPNNVNDVQSITTNTNHVFLSESSFREQQILTSTLQFSNDANGPYRLRVFSSSLSELDTSQEFNTSLQALPPTTNISAAVYTAKTKDEYVHPRSFKRLKLTLETQPTSSTTVNQGNATDAERIRFTFNEKPSHRMNCSDAKEEHMLYVICQHSSAATAYLHHLGNELIKREETSKKDEETSAEQVADHDQIAVEIA